MAVLMLALHSTNLTQIRTEKKKKSCDLGEGKSNKV